MVGAAQKVLQHNCTISKHIKGPVGDDRGLVFVVGGQDADSDAETVDLENPVPENCDEPADFTFPAIYDAAPLLMSNGAPAICGGKVGGTFCCLIY